MSDGSPTRIGGLVVERELGRGAFGVVYLARDPLIGRRVALKVLETGAAEIPEEVLSEARLIGNLSSGHVVTLYRVHAPQAGTWMLEMEYVPGGSLHDRVQEHGAFPPHQVVAVLRGICRALEAAHAARIVHGDIKPENVLFGEGGVVKLADFGIARLIGAGGVASRPDGQIAGTLMYMAPEVFQSKGSRMASDLWSVGVLGYEIASGRLPFQGESVGELLRAALAAQPEPLPATVPAPLGELLLRLMSRAPEDRPESAAAVVAELDRMAALDTRLAGAVAAADRPTNVLAPATSFVGRREDLDALREWVATGEHRLLTIAGPGGMGKTRLAQHLCLEVLPHLEGGAWFVDLSEVRDASAAAHAVADALGVPHADAADPVRLVADVIRFRKPMLLVLDNFEQLLDHAEALVGRWRQAAPDIRFVVTTRARLNLADEHFHDLQPLSFPTDVGPLTAEEASAYDALRLFADRAAEARPGFRIDDDCAADVAAICRDLDGMPLAIELAAARARIMRPAQIASKLGQRFQLLRSPRRDTTRRQSTLNAAIEWSFDLLCDWERSAYLQACYFSEGFALESAEAVIDLLDYPDAPFAMDVAQGLREKSLLVAFDAGQETRLGMYRSILEYGRRRWKELASAEDQEALARRHAEHYVVFADECTDHSRSVRGRFALERIDLEIGNFEKAYHWAAASGEDGLATAAVLGVAETMKVHRPPRQLLPLLEGALVMIGEEESERRVRLLVYRSGAHQVAGSWDLALADADTAVALARRVGASEALALLQMGEMHRNRGDAPGALAAFEECARLARRDGNAFVEAAAVGHRGMVLGQHGDLDDAFDCFQRAERQATDVGDDQTVALHLGNQGVVYERRGDLARALECQYGAEDLARRLGDRLRVSVAVGAQGAVLAQMGRLDESLARLREAEAIARDLGARQRVAHFVGNRGNVLTMRGEYDDALACLEEAEAIARELGDGLRIARCLWQRARLVEGTDPKAALACYVEAERIGVDLDDQTIVARSRMRRGSVHRAMGDLPAARDALRSGLELLDAMGARNLFYLADHGTLALVCRDLGDMDEARRLAREGLELARALQITPEHPEPSIEGLIADLTAILAD